MAENDPNVNSGEQTPPPPVSPIVQTKTEELAQKVGTPEAMQVTPVLQMPTAGEQLTNIRPRDQAP